MCTKYLLNLVNYCVMALYKGIGYHLDSSDWSPSDSALYLKIWNALQSQDGSATVQRIIELRETQKSSSAKSCIRNVELGAEMLSWEQPNRSSCIIQTSLCMVQGAPAQRNGMSQTVRSRWAQLYVFLFFKNIKQPLYPELQVHLKWEEIVLEHVCDSGTQVWTKPICWLIPQPPHYNQAIGLPCLIEFSLAATLHNLGRGHFQPSHLDPLI